MFKGFCLGLLWALSACDDRYRDTCSGGDNMSHPSISSGVDLTAQSPELHLTWQRGTGVGATLPDTYFDSVRSHADSVSRAVIESVEHVAPREILIRLAREALLENLQASNELELILVLPDRRIAIACTHPGSVDTYLVNITLEVNEGVLTRATVEQSVHLGDF